MNPLVACGRLLSRAFINGIYNTSVPSSSCATPATAAEGSKDCASRDEGAEQIETSRNSKVLSRTKGELYLLTAISGFPKDFSTGVVKPGRFGDDAYFVAHHPLSDVIGVADGVGGWRQWGVDPGVFAESLMRACDRLVSAGRFTPRKPAAILAAAYQELTQEKRHIIGSSTACVIALDRERGWLYAANIGDSGFRVVRNGAFIHRSQEQQHYFNTPFQLSLPPPGSRANILSDSPERADTTELKVEPGDVILLCSDGVLDNVPESLLLPQLASLVHTDPDPCLLQKTANSIALQARSLAFDSNFLSPFAMAARKNGIAANGGKPDDITILLATVMI